MTILSYREALNRAMTEEMEKDPNIFVMGEEVAEYDGAYKVTQGMLAKFGKKRIIDTPISENSFSGLGVGAAMLGLRPIIEFMTWNFALLAIDNIINSAAKMCYMSGGQFNIPIVFRGPNGAGGRLSAQHSQSFESFYAHVPGLKVVIPSTPADAYGLLKTSILDENPVIFLENEILYNSKGDVLEQEYKIPLGKAEIKKQGKDITIISWSRILHETLAAAETLMKEGLSVEVLDLRSIKPLDETLIIESVKKTNRVLIVEEGWNICGFGSQIAYLIQKKAFDYLDAPIERLHQTETPMSYAENLERASLPNQDSIVKKVKEMLS